MGISEKVQSIVNKLNVLYRTGTIPYPRVDADFFEEEKRLDMFAHPRICFPSKVFEDLEPCKIGLSKETSILYLSLLRILSPSNIVNFSKFIDEFFDDNLEYNSKEKEKLAEGFIEGLANFMIDENITQEELIDYYKSLFIESRKRKIALYSLKQTTFLHALNFFDSRIHKFIPDLMSSSTKYDVNNEDEYFKTLKSKDSLYEALEEYNKSKHFKGEEDGD
jgi:hypothetical protein